MSGGCSEAKPAIYQYSVGFASLPPYTLGILIFVKSLIFL